MECCCYAHTGQLVKVVIGEVGDDVRAECGGNMDTEDHELIDAGIFNETGNSLAATVSAIPTAHKSLPKI